MKRHTSRWTARFAAFLLVVLLALGAWAQKQGHFAEQPLAPRIAGTLFAGGR